MDKLKLVIESINCNSPFNIQVIPTPLNFSVKIMFAIFNFEYQYFILKVCITNIKSYLFLCIKKIFKYCTKIYEKNKDFSNNLNLNTVTGYSHHYLKR